tara:strand:+ start:3016 stop:3294 length:279 start_codon:yes stop_codon:yes gene_type:complete
VQPKPLLSLAEIKALLEDLPPSALSNKTQVNLQFEWTGSPDISQYLANLAQGQAHKLYFSSSDIMTLWADGVYIGQGLFKTDKAGKIFFELS